MNQSETELREYLRNTYATMTAKEDRTYANPHEAFGYFKLALDHLSGAIRVANIDNGLIVAICAMFIEAAYQTTNLVSRAEQVSFDDFVNDVAVNVSSYTFKYASAPEVYARLFTQIRPFEQMVVSDPPHIAYTEASDVKERMFNIANIAFRYATEFFGGDTLTLTEL